MSKFLKVSEKIEFELAKSLKVHKNAVAAGKASAKAKALAEGVTTRTRTRLPVSKNDTDKPDKYEIFNEKLKPFYPKREGSNPWRAAAECVHARLKEGITMEEMIAGTSRYFAYCEEKQNINTSMVMQAKRFYGRDCEFKNDWKISEQSRADALRFPRKGDMPAWTRFATENGCKTKPGESQQAFEARITSEVTRKGREIN